MSTRLEHVNRKLETLQLHLLQSMSRYRESVMTYCADLIEKNNNSQLTELKKNILSNFRDLSVIQENIKGLKKLQHDYVHIITLEGGTEVIDELLPTQISDIDDIIRRSEEDMKRGLKQQKQNLNEKNSNIDDIIRRSEKDMKRGLRRDLGTLHIRAARQVLAEKQARETVDEGRDRDDVRG